MAYKMDEIRKIYKAKFVLLFVLILFPVCCSSVTSTVCYGSPGLKCVTHILSCRSPLVIQIINTSFGYRSECNDKYGLTSCINTKCCEEKPDDCIVKLSPDDQWISGNCSGNETCSIHGVRRYIKNDTICNGVSSYSKIQYDCVPKGFTTIARSTDKRTTELKRAREITSTTHFKDLTTSTSSTAKSSTVLTTSFFSTSQYSTDITTESLQRPVVQNENLGVVGGVLGTLLIISIIINVGLVVYFTRKMKSLTKRPQENNYDDLANTGREETLPTYDVLQVNSTASSNHDKMKSDSHHTYCDTKEDQLSHDNIDHNYENMKRS